MTHITQAFYRIALVLGVLLIGRSFGQAGMPFDYGNLNLTGGATGIFVSGNSTWWFCHDVNTTVYQYTDKAAFGVGTLAQTGNNTWTGSGQFIKCGGVKGSETITFFSNNGTLISERSYNGIAALGLGKINSTTLVFEKNGTSEPTPGQCWWLNEEHFGVKTIQGSWQGPVFYYDTCLIGNSFSRIYYNGTANVTTGNATSGSNSTGSNETSQQVFEGFESGITLLDIGFSGDFIELRNFTFGCDQGCDLFKVGGDGDFLYDRYFCTLEPTQDDVGYDEYARRVNSTTLSHDHELPSLCLFAIQPEYGYLPIYSNADTLNTDELAALPPHPNIMSNDSYLGTF